MDFGYFKLSDNPTPYIARTPDHSSPDITARCGASDGARHAFAGSAASFQLARRGSPAPISARPRGAAPEESSLAPAGTVLPLPHPIRVPSMATLDLRTTSASISPRARYYTRETILPSRVRDNQGIFEEGLALVRPPWAGGRPHLASMGRTNSFRDNVLLTPKPVHGGIPPMWRRSPSSRSARGPSRLRPWCGALRAR